MENVPTITARSIIACALSLFCATAPTAGQCPPKYEVTAIIQGPECGILGFGNTNARGLNELGEVVGSYGCPLGVSSPFYWSLETGLIMLDTPEWMPGGTARGISDEGTIVGVFTKELVGTRAFVFKDDVWMELPPVDPSSGYSWANAVSPDGRFVVGWRSITSEINPFNAFIWDSTSSEFVDLGVMNGPNSAAEDVSSSGHLAGWTGSQLNPTSPFIYIEGTLDIPGLIPGTINSFALAVNSAGAALCTGRISLNPSIGITALYEDGIWTILPNLPNYGFTAGGDINDDRIAIGAGTVTLSGLPIPRACIWVSGSVHDLNDLIPPSNSIELKTTAAINNAGQILCGGVDSRGENVGVLLTPIASIPPDLNLDGQVGVVDLAQLLSEWGSTKCSDADLNQDGFVGPADLAELLANWG